MFRLKKRKAQSTAEYVVVLGLIVAAVVGMQTYVKRGFQGRIKEAVDFVDNGGQTTGVVAFTRNYQYEPYYLSSNFESTQNVDTSEELLTGGAVNRDIDQEYRTRNGVQTIGIVEQNQ